MKRHAAATERNREPLAAVLREVLPATGVVLEVASGTGEHAAWFARLFPHLDWQPSDAEPDAIASIEAWAADSGAANLRPPLVLDAAAESWPVGAADAILCVNMVHISPWSATAYSGRRSRLTKRSTRGSGMAPRAARAVRSTAWPIRRAAMLTSRRRSSGCP